MLLGCDLSHWQPTADIKAAKADGLAFLINKASEGTTLRDDTYAARRSLCRINGVLFGAYHFLDHGKDPTAQADFFLNCAKPDGQTALFLDWEQGTAAEAEAFIQHIHDVTGIWIGLYTRASYIIEQLGSRPSLLVRCPAWLATYGPKPVTTSQFPNWKLWQSSNGQDGPPPYSFKGIGNCDIDRFDGTLQNLQDFWRGISPDAMPVVIEPTVVTRWVFAVSLNVRSAPRVVAGNILTQLPYGTQITINGARPVNGFVALVENGKTTDKWVSESWLVDFDPTIKAPAPAPQPVPQPKPAPTPEPPPANGGGIGVQALGGAWDDRLAKYPCFKAVDNPSAVTRYHQLNPLGLVIHRHYYAQDAHQYIGSDPHGAAQRWVNENIGTIKALPYALHESFNEAGSDPLMVAFETERVELLSQVGTKACVLNLSTGTYNDDSLWQRDDVKKLATLVEQTGGAIGLHCYGEGVLSSNCGSAYWRNDGLWSGSDPFPANIDPTQCWLALRILRVRDVLRAEGLQPRLIATELGLDDCTGGDSKNGVYKPFGIQVRGWKDCQQVWNRMAWLSGTDAAAFYHKQLDWWYHLTGMFGLVYAYNDDTEGVSGPRVYDVQDLF